MFGTKEASAAAREPTPRTLARFAAEVADGSRDRSDVRALLLQRYTLGLTIEYLVQNAILMYFTLKSQSEQDILVRPTVSLEQWLLWG